jgi:hypothetical protein
MVEGVSRKAAALPHFPPPLPPPLTLTQPPPLPFCRYARLTWEGPPFNIRDFGLVLDQCVYHSVDGDNLNNGIKGILNRWGRLQKGGRAATAEKEEEGRGGTVPLATSHSFTCMHTLPLLTHTHTLSLGLLRCVHAPRHKGRMVLSIMKSMAGWQVRDIKELGKASGNPGLEEMSQREKGKGQGAIKSFLKSL